MMYEEPIQNSVITIPNVLTILKINNEKFYWWFSLLDHEKPNIDDYEFTGDTLNSQFPELIEELKSLKEKKRLQERRLKEE